MRAYIYTYESNTGTKTVNSALADNCHELFQEVYGKCNGNVRSFTILYSEAVYDV